MIDARRYITYPARSRSAAAEQLIGYKMAIYGNIMPTRDIENIKQPSQPGFPTQHKWASGQGERITSATSTLSRTEGN